MGKELARILYSLNAKVYLASRTEATVNQAIADITSSAPKSTGALEFLPINLEDLDSVRAAATSFLSKESRLDGLWNNAGMMQPPAGSKSKQGYELQLGVNCLACFLFTRLLTPILAQTAKSEPPSAVRVVWVASSAVELFSPPGGVYMENLDYRVEVSASQKYAISKAGLVLLAQEYARRYKDEGIISVVIKQHLPLIIRNCANMVIAGHQPRESQNRPTAPPAGIPGYCLWLDQLGSAVRRIYRALRWLLSRDHDRELWMLGHSVGSDCASPTGHL